MNWFFLALISSITLSFIEFFVKKELIILGGTLNREKVEQIHKEKIKEMVKQLKIYST